MGRFLVMIMVFGGCAVGFAAASQAGMTLPQQPVRSTIPEKTVTASQIVKPSCRIEKTLKYDFHGTPYIRKVRVCA
jgi:hypothetical protein